MQKVFSLQSSICHSGQPGESETFVSLPDLTNKVNGYWPARHPFSRSCLPGLPVRVEQRLSSSHTLFSSVRSTQFTPPAFQGCTCPGAMNLCSRETGLTPGPYQTGVRTKPLATTSRWGRPPLLRPLLLRAHVCVGCCSCVRTPSKAAAPAYAHLFTLLPLC